MLDSNLPGNITHYDFATTALSGTDNTIVNAGIFQDENAFLFGLSPASPTDASDQAVGRNMVAGYVENPDFSGVAVLSGNTDNDVLIFYNDPDTSGDHVLYETQFASGDSGGPTFIDNSGKLLLLGTNGSPSWPTEAIPKAPRSTTPAIKPPRSTNTSVPTPFRNPVD